MEVILWLNIFSDVEKNDLLSHDLSLKHFFSCTDYITYRLGLLKVIYINHIDF